VACSSELAPGSAAASAGVVLDAGLTAAVVVLTVADSLVAVPHSRDAAELAASVAALRMKQCAAVAASTVVAADTAAAATAADIGNPQSSLKDSRNRQHKPILPEVPPGKDGLFCFWRGATVDPMVRDFALRAQHPNRFCGCVTFDVTRTF
jgi:hypothetical protein